MHAVARMHTHSHSGMDQLCVLSHILNLKMEKQLLATTQQDYGTSSQLSKAPSIDVLKSQLKTKLFTDAFDS